jgi:tRNA pseudouridine32 synthase/23S rRNA pseudouridine746 synthase
MLAGMEVDPNPMLINVGAKKVIETLYEDEYLLAVNKPEGLLSVPGKTIADCVANRLKEKYPEATGPLVVHRLDQGTSGIYWLQKPKKYTVYCRSSLSAERLKSVMWLC